MTPQKPIEIDPDEVPGAPESIVIQLRQRLRSCQRVVVSHYAAKNRPKVINAIRFSNKRGHEPPHSAEEIAQIVVQIMHAHYLEHVDDDDFEPKYRIACELCKSPTHKGKNPQAPYFDHTYQPGTDDDDFDRIRNLEFHTMFELLENMRSQNGQLAAYNSELQNLVLEMGRSFAAPGNSATQLSQATADMFGQAAQMLGSLFEQRYSMDAARVEQEHRDKRLQILMEKIGPFLKIAAHKFVPNAANAAPGGPANGAPTQPAQSDSDSGDEPIENPLALIAHSFSQSLTPQQHRDLNAMLTKKQRALFDDVFCASDDAQAVAAWGHAKNGLPADVLLQLLELVTPEQSQMFQAFMAEAESRKSA